MGPITATIIHKGERATVHIPHQQRGTLSIPGHQAVIQDESLWGGSAHVVIDGEPVEKIATSGIGYYDVDNETLLVVTHHDGNVEFRDLLRPSLD